MHKHRLASINAFVFANIRISQDVDSSITNAELNHPYEFKSTFLIENFCFATA